MQIYYAGNDKMDILDVLESRGYIEQITDEENLRELFKKE